jgi:GDP-L-fucose synthase
MSKIRILLTGGRGMVGRNVLDHPEIDNFEVLAPSRQELDLCNYPAVYTYIEKIKPDFVIHAAGKVGGIQANMQDLLGFLLENLDMGRNVVGAAHQLGVKRLINLGSSCMYPRGHNDPLQENQLLKGEFDPTNEGYGLAKMTVTKMCDYISQKSSNLQYKTLIPCNLYGRYDKFDPKHSHLIPAIIHKIHLAKQKGEQQVEIWGDGTARREFMYAGDLADTIIQAVKRFEALPPLMNVGLGHDYTVNEYYQAVAEVIGYKGQFTHNLSKPVGMARKLLNVDLQQKWQWSPSFDLKTGISHAYQFYLMETHQ